jgi:hypothetical protein
MEGMLPAKFVVTAGRMTNGKRGGRMAGRRGERRHGSA